MISSKKLMRSWQKNKSEPRKKVLSPKPDSNPCKQSFDCELFRYDL